jgi:hypothetical protein
MFGRNAGERNFDWLNNEERTGQLIMLNNYLFRQDGFCGQHAIYLTDKCHGI